MMAVFESKSRLRPEEGRVHMLLRPKPWKYALGLESQFLSPSQRPYFYDFSLVMDSGAFGLETLLVLIQMNGSRLQHYIVVNTSH